MQREWRREHLYKGQQKKKKDQTTKTTPLMNLNMVELLLRAATDVHGVWSDSRVKTMIYRVVQQRVPYLWYRGRSLNEEISREEANKLVVAWRNSKYPCLHSERSVAKKAFEQFLSEEFGGYKIVLLVLRLGYLNQFLLGLYAWDILSHSKLGPIPRSIHQNRHAWNYNDPHKLYKCEICTQDFANAVPCRRCKAAFGNCCASADSTLCKFCTPDDDSAVERMVRAYHQAVYEYEVQQQTYYASMQW
jgi:hypothetical protein